MTIQVRALTEIEQTELKRLAHSRTEEARLVERAAIIWGASQGEKRGELAQRLGVDPDRVRAWIKRFNEAGLAGLRDRPRAGRPPTYTVEQVAEVVAAALTNPQELGQPFGCWTLDRLQVYLNETKQIAIKRSRIDEILRDEGLRWRTQEKWFGQRPDPDFAQKKRPS